jgi:Domain of unknown function (DUF4833)
MKNLSLILGAFLIAISWSVSDACIKSDPLFRIERSKNENVVQYDACIISDGDLSDSDPVSVYWILEKGQREDLSGIEKLFVYGIKFGKKLEKDKVEISLVALGNRKGVVEKNDGKYRVVVSINGKESILEKIYVKSEEELIGPPEVLYIDLFGRTLAADTPVRERIVPKD